VNSALLHVEGKSDAVNGLLDTLRRKPDAEWKAGELRRRGGKYEESGFTLTIADATTPHDMVIVGDVEMGYGGLPARQ
jgi:hypothetical protein